MGQVFSKRKRQICFCGLDGTGKTTFLYQLCGKEMNSISPTSGYAIEEVTVAKTEWVIMDVGSLEGPSASLVNVIFRSEEGMIYFIDATEENTSRLKDQLNSLASLLSSPFLAPSLPFVLFVNKIDLPSKFNEKTFREEIAKRLDLVSLMQLRKWTLLFGSGRQKINVTEALDWLASNIEEEKK